MACRPCAPVCGICGFGGFSLWAGHARICVQGWAWGLAVAVGEQRCKIFGLKRSLTSLLMPRGFADAVFTGFGSQRSQFKAP